MIVITELQFFVSSVFFFPFLYLCFDLLEGYLWRLEAHIARNLSPKLISSMFKWVVFDRLSIAFLIKDLFRMIAYFFTKIVLVVSDSCLHIVDIGSILVWHCLSKFLIRQALLFTWRSGSYLTCTFNCRLTYTGLIVTFPMLSSCFKQIEAISILRLAIFFSLYLIIRLDHTASRKVQSRRSAFNNMLGMVVLRLGVLDMIFFVIGVVMIEVLERFDLVCFSFGRWPYLIVSLELFSLFDSRVGTIWVAFVATVANHLVYHFIYYPEVTNLNLPIKYHRHHLLNQLFLLWLWLLCRLSPIPIEAILSAFPYILWRLSLSLVLAVLMIMLLIRSGFKGYRFM